MSADTPVPVAVCAVHGLRFDQLPRGAALFGSMIVASLSWSAQLFLNLFVNDASASGVVVSVRALHALYDEASTRAPLEDTFESIIQSIEAAGIVVHDPDGYRVTQAMWFDPDRQDYVVL